jgi:outer membrane lipoprotein-sorting protein
MTFKRGWIPAILAPAVVVAGGVLIPTIANAATPPPQKTAAQVLTLIAGSHDAHYSGTVEQSSDLGLPQLPSSLQSAPASGGFDAASVLQLVTGSHTAKVYVDGQSRQRVQLLDTLSERDLIHNGTSMWTYDAKQRTAAHVTASTAQAKSRMPQDVTPAALADRFIASIEPSTTVTVSTGTDLGRGVYRLRLAPKTTATLVGDVVVTVDAQTGVPLAVRVDARHQSAPALSVAFTSFDANRPDASVFAFSPPQGTTVKNVTLPGDLPQHPRMTKGDLPRPTVIGTGWTSVVEVPAGKAVGKAEAGASGTGAGALLDGMTQRVSGGRILQTSLFTVYLRDDGTVFAGAVPTATLLAAAK